MISGIPDQTIGIYGDFNTLSLSDYVAEVDGDSLSWGVSFGTPDVTEDLPSWTLDPSSFELTMSATILVESKNAAAEGSTHTLAALSSDGSVRGLATATAYLDNWIYFLTIYSDTNGDTISFQFFDSVYSQDLPANETIVFANNGVIGSPDEPLLLEAGYVLVNINQEGSATIDVVNDQWTGTETLSFTVQDFGTLNSYSASDEMQLTVMPDFSPVVSGIPDASVELGTAFSVFDLADYVETFDDDVVTWTVSGEEHLSVSITGSNVTVTAADDSWVGTESLIFTATDNTVNQFSGSDTSMFEIRAVDHAPVISGIPDQTISIGQEFENINLNSFLSEVDNDSVTWGFKFLPLSSPDVVPDWAVIPANFEYSMAITAQVYSLSNPALGSNHKLAGFTSNEEVMGVSIAQDYLGDWLYFMTLYSNDLESVVELLFYDAESERIISVFDTITFQANGQLGSPDIPYRIDAGNLRSSLNSDNIISFETVEPIWEFPETIQFIATDYGTINEYSSTYNISLMMNNDVAQINIDDQNINEGGIFLPLDLRSSILDNFSPFDSLEISVTGQTIFDVDIINDTLFVSTPVDTNWFGADTITIEVLDKHPYNPIRSQKEISFNVAPVNDVPVIAVINNQEINEDTSIQLNLSAVDVDDDVFTFESFTLTGDIVTDISDQTLTINPVLNWYGSGDVEVVVKDQAGASDTTVFSLTVLPVNDKPVAYEDSVSVLEDISLSFNLRGLDIDGDSLRFELIRLPESGTADLISNLLVFQPDKDWYGADFIEYLVSDGQSVSDTGVVHITVIPENDMPIAIIKNNTLTSIQGQSVIIDGSDSFDPDNDSLTYSWEVPILLGANTDISSKISLIIPTLDNETTFLLFLRVSDGLEISKPDTLVLNVLATDVNDILPSFSDEEISLDQPVNVSVSIPDFFTVDSINLHYANALSGFLKKDMTQQGSRSRTFSAQIEKSMVGTQGLAYFVQVKDSLGNIIKTDTTDIQLSFPADMVLSSMDHSPFISGLLSDTWRIISIPSIVNDNSVTTLFSSVLNGEPNEEDWIIYDWDSPEWIVPELTESGRGYWIKQFNQPKIDFAIGSGTTNKLTGIDINLKSGWNLISSPYLFPVNINIDQENFSELFYYDGSGWADTVVSKMVPWGGYAIFNYTSNDAPIKLRPLDDSEAISRSRSLNTKGWTVNVQVQGTRYSDKKNQFGVREHSNLGIDIEDCPEPPTVGQYVALYSNIETTTNDLTKLTKDFRELSEDLQVWDLTIETNIEGFDGQIETNMTGIFGENELWLLDLQNRQSIQLFNGENTYHPDRIKDSKKENKFKLIYGSKVEIMNTIEFTLAQIPTEFSLKNNYPNPFNPITNIPFTVSEPAHVKISIYNVRGVLVDVLTNRNWHIGSHKVIWDTRNQEDNPVGTGVYFYKMEANGFVTYNKMILLK